MRDQGRSALLRHRGRQLSAEHRLGGHYTISGSLSRGRSIGIENAIVVGMEMLLVLASRQPAVKSRPGLRISRQENAQGDREHGRILDGRFECLVVVVHGLTSRLVGEKSGKVMRGL